jgi:ketosteroid isomerase-like protein
MIESPQDAQTRETIAVIDQMEAVITRHDVDGLLALCADDVVWETTTPPDGERFEGKVANKAAMEAFFQSSPRATFEREHLAALGEYAALRWRYAWVDAEGKPGHVRGVDIIRVRGGKIAENLSYVKG